MSPRIGSLVFSTDQGLGILSKSFHDHGVITDVITVAHGRRPEHPEWYPDAFRLTDMKNLEQMEQVREFCKSMDVMLFLETPFIWELLPYCREVGVKTFLMPMYECMPTKLPYQPDRFLCPSLLDLRYFPDRSTFVPIPAPDPTDVPWRLRERAEVFVHNAGHGGLKGRNGTAEVLEAWKIVKSPARLLLRTQDVQEYKSRFGTLEDQRVEIEAGTVLYTDLYEEGDVFVFPEKFNGLSLPLQEAHAAGMLVMAGNRFPMNTWLPNEPLIPVKGYTRSRVAGRCLEFDEAVYDPQVIAATIDAWYGKDITVFSEWGQRWAIDNSWANLKPRYMEELSK